MESSAKWYGTSECHSGWCDTAITYLCALAEKVVGFRLRCASRLHPHIGLLACSNEEKTFVNKVDRKKKLGVVSHTSDMGHIYHLHLCCYLLPIVNSLWD